MSILSSFARQIAPIAAAIPGPHTPYVMAYQAATAVQDQQKMSKDVKHQELVQQQRGNQMEFRDTNNIL